MNVGDLDPGMMARAEGEFVDINRRLNQLIEATSKIRFILSVCGMTDDSAAAAYLYGQIESKSPHPESTIALLAAAAIRLSKLEESK